ncbi:biotin transporter BioY [Planococcus sp. CP5-4]|uniref:biotin transporter BioY n=1 Tax=unclassified Planococcus (in: firmicutes) TaxID=2662419 RepID=UPI001C2274F7|nr:MULTISPECIES: biotin transporter BioY [unclassified Planococcus (in: firmicutes)]MBU9674548.1 biotin transporter BioY [Planococcus sp. CP5-4_YE]MBV0910288.1 biotin transporter BioY [Planococcus sp. CP5-4_UN]MBW6065139.1 biotin transporter BioY [Planococcus sp. CP5-4]
MTTSVSRSSNHSRTLTLVHIAMFAALMAIGANISSFLIVGGVPITLQTFFAVLAGILLGKRLGAASMIVYAAIGLAGVPVFAKFSGGMDTLISPTFGFIVSYIFTAFAAGWIAEKMPSKKGFIFAALVATAVNYVFGTNWMYAAYKLWFAAPEGFTYGMAWAWMAVPLPKDVLLAIFAGLFGFRIQPIINKYLP